MDVTKKKVRNTEKALDTERKRNMQIRKEKKRRKM